MFINSDLFEINKQQISSQQKLIFLVSQMSNIPDNFDQLCRLCVGS